MGRLILLSLMTLMILALVPFALADSVEIYSAKVISDGRVGVDSVDINPNSNLTVTVVIQSKFTLDDDEDVEIDEVNVELLIPDIDGGSDLDHEFDEFSMEPNEKKTLTHTFTIPWAVENKNFYLEISMKAEDDYGNKYRDDERITLNMRKAENKVVASHYEFSDGIVCGQSVVISIEVTNVGKKDEDDVILELENDLLGYYYKSTNIDLEEGEDDSQVTKKYTLNVPEGKKGNYPLEVTLTYDDGDIREKTFVPFNIKCDGEVKGEKEEQEEEKGQTGEDKKEKGGEEIETKTEYAEPENSDIEGKKPTIETVQSQLPAIEGSTLVKEGSLFDKIDEDTFLIVAGELLVVLIIVFIILLVRSAK